MGVEQKRYRFSVPEGDKSVHNWIASQANLSFSLRTLIKNCISQMGYVDVTCGKPMEKASGRPNKTIQESVFEKADSGELYNSEPNSKPEVIEKQPVVTKKEDDKDDMAAMFSFKR